MKSNPKNQCAACGKFKKWDNLIYMAGDSDDTGKYPEWYECVDCAPQADVDRHLEKKKTE